MTAHVAIDRPDETSVRQSSPILAALRTHWPIWAGFCAVMLPTLWRLKSLSWGGEQGAFGVIVLAIGLWLVSREWPAMRAAAAPPPAWRAILALATALLLYVVARLGVLFEIEAFAAYLVGMATLYSLVGGRAMRAAWFPLLYLLLAMPTDSALAPLTQGLRLRVSDAAIELLHFFDVPVGVIGQSMYVDSYEIVMKQACSGLSAILSLGAVGLFYVFVLRGPRFWYLLAAGAVMLAAAILANFARVVVLLLMTHWAGDAVAQGFLHQGTGLVMFAIAVGGVILFDAAAWPVLRRLRMISDLD